MHLRSSLLPALPAALCLVLVIGGIPGTHGKVLRKCDFARAMEAHKESRSNIAMWTCLAQAESQMNTALVTTNTKNSTKYYGIFQLNDREWCREAFRGGECNVKCSELIKDNISESIKCARIRYLKYGWKDWPTFETKCKQKGLPNLRDCWDGIRGRARRFTLKNEDGLQLEEDTIEQFQEIIQ